MRHPALLALSLACLSLAPQAHAAGTTTYGSLAGFQAATGATAATGALPAVAPGSYVAAPSGTAVGSVSFFAPGFGFTDWSTLLPGSEITVSNGAGNTSDPNIYYNDGLDAVFAAPVHSAGFWFHQPTSPSGYIDACNVTPCVASQFQVQLKDGATVVATLAWTPQLDQAEFWGVASATAFTRMEIREIVGTDDNEYYGSFYTGSLAPVPEPGSAALWLAGLAALGLGARRTRRTRR